MEASRNRMAEPAHANNFDFLRLIGAALVIYGHAYVLTGNVPPVFDGNGVHTIGVKIFFVISGYLVAQSWLRDQNLFRFACRRSLRIFPALIAVVVLTVAVVGPAMTTLPLSAYFSDRGLAVYLRNIALYINYALPGVFAHNTYPIAVNGSLWSLPAEVSMYLFTPIMLSPLIIRRKAVFAVGTIALCAASLALVCAFPRHSVYVIYGTSLWAWLEVAPYFVIGAAFPLYRLERLANIHVAFVAVCALAMVPLGAVASQLALMIVLPSAVIAFGLGFTPVFRSLTRGNDLSYGVFLWGFPVQQVLVATLGPQTGPVANCLMALAVSSALAYLSWNFIELPMLSLKPRRGKPVLPVMATPLAD
jgi:peptidoglycan/LPS O-acetylase OafA/YrhL